MKYFYALLNLLGTTLLKAAWFWFCMMLVLIVVGLIKQFIFSNIDINVNFEPSNFYLFAFLHYVFSWLLFGFLVSFIYAKVVSEYDKKLNENVFVAVLLCIGMYVFVQYMDSISLLMPNQNRSIFSVLHKIPETMITMLLFGGIFWVFAIFPIAIISLEAICLYFFLIKNKIRSYKKFNNSNPKNH